MLSGRNTVLRVFRPTPGSALISRRRLGLARIGRSIDAPGGFSRRCRMTRRRFAARRQPAGDGGAAPGAEFDLDRAAMQLDEALDQRQAEPGAGSRACGLPRSNFSKMRTWSAGGDADAGIGDRQQQIAVARARLEPDRAAGRGEFDRVRDQVEERLLQPPLVGVDRADIRRAVEARVRAPGCAPARASASAPLEHLPEYRPLRVSSSM